MIQYFNLDAPYSKDFEGHSNLEILKSHEYVSWYKNSKLSTIQKKNIFNLKLPLSYWFILLIYDLNKIHISFIVGENLLKTDIKYVTRSKISQEIT